MENVSAGRLNLRLSVLFRCSTNVIARFVESKVAPHQIRQPLWVLKISDGFLVKNTFLPGLRTQGTGPTSAQSAVPPCPILSEPPPFIGCLSACSIANNNWKLPLICLLAQKHRGTRLHHMERTMKPRPNYPSLSRCCTRMSMPNIALQRDRPKAALLSCP